VAEMIFYTFYDSNNDFTDLIKDRVVKANFKISWDKHIMLGFEDEADEKMLGYILIKYGEMIRNPFELDRTPIPNVDYIPKRRH
jgi:hypothetical protein